MTLCKERSLLIAALCTLGMCSWAQYTDIALGRGEGGSRPPEEVICYRAMLARFQPLAADHLGMASQHGTDRSALFHIIVDIPGSNSVRASAVLFDAYSVKVMPEFHPWLDHVAALVNEHPRTHLLIEAHTDSIGSAVENQHLSERRAKAIREELIARGVRRDRMTTQGMGERYPIDTNGTVEGRHRNRRVELWTLFPVTNRLSLLVEAPPPR